MKMDFNTTKPLQTHAILTTLCVASAPTWYPQSSGVHVVSIASVDVHPRSSYIWQILSTCGWNWVPLFYLGIFIHFAYMMHTFWWKAPTGVYIAAYPTVVGRWVTAVRMIFDSGNLMKQAYDESKGRSFAIPMLDRWMIFVSDRAHLKLLEAESETVLSMEQALHELAFTGPILGKLQVAPEKNKPKSEGFRVMVGVLKNKLRSHVPEMSEAFREAITEAFNRQVDQAKTDAEGWNDLAILPILLQVFTRVNLIAFFGEQDGKSAEIYNDVMDFFWSCANAFPFVSLTPEIIMPLISPIAMGFGFTRQKVYKRFLPRTRSSLDGTSKDVKNITHWTAEMTKLKDVAAVAKITLGLLFASAFQVPMIAQFVIYRLCTHPTYCEKLVEEATTFEGSTFGARNQEMPYMDSFIKETSRLGPGPILSAPRTVMKPYTMPDGCHIPTGNWIAIPQVTLMRDPMIWKNADTFEGFRFVSDASSSESRWTHPSYEFPFWGSIKHACPARFYVSVVMKMILSHILLNYEFKLKDEKARPYITFGKVRLPSPFVRLLVKRKRSAGAE